MYRGRFWQSARCRCRSVKDAERAAYAAFLEWRAGADAAGPADPAVAAAFGRAVRLHESALAWVDGERAALERTGEVPLEEWVDPERPGAARTPDEWAAYLDAERDRIAAALADLRKASGKARPAAPGPEAYSAAPPEASAAHSAHLDRAMRDPRAAGPLEGPALEGCAWVRRLAGFHGAERRAGVEAGPADRSVAALVGRYLDSKRADVKPGSWNRERQRLAHLTDWAGTGDASKIGADFLEGYKRHVLGVCEPAPGGRGWSRQNAALALNVARSWVRWLHRSEFLDALPRNVGAVKVTVPRSAPRAPDPSALRPVLEACEGSPLWLWTSLCANCGFYPVDLGALRLDEIDFGTGTVTRTRTKTDGRGGPAGRWVLWDRVLVALRDAVDARPTPDGPDADGRALLNRGGGVLWRAREGRAKLDATKSARDRLRTRRPDLTVPPLSAWRKAGASALRDSEFADVRGVWAGHAAGNVTDRHYAGAPLSRCVRACGFLGTVYGFETDPARLEAAAALR